MTYPLCLPRSFRLWLSSSLCPRSESQRSWMVRVTGGPLQVPLPWPALGKHPSSLNLDCTRVPLHKESYYCRTRRLTPPCRAQGSWEAMGMSSAPWGDRGGGSSLPNVLCCPGVGENLGNIIHNQLKSTVYPVLASVHSLGQGELDQCPVCAWVQQVSSRNQFSHPPPLDCMYRPSSTQVFLPMMLGGSCMCIPAYSLATCAQRQCPLWL